MVSANSELGYNGKVEGEVIVSRADAVINWIRTNSVWPMPMGLACCAIELMAVGNGRFDIARFGAELGRFGSVRAEALSPYVFRIHDLDAATRAGAPQARAMSAASSATSSAALCP